MPSFNHTEDPGYGSFKSHLSNSMTNEKTNAECLLTLNLFLDKVNPDGNAATGGIADSNGDVKQIQKWTTAEWASFKAALVSRSQKFWNGKFWLQHDTCNKLDWPYDGKPTHRPNVYCRFKINLVDNIAKAHRKIQCVRPQLAAGAAGQSTTFRSHWELFDYFDTAKTDFKFNEKGKQEGDATKVSYTIVHHSDVHEIGHLLGLGHSNENESNILQILRDIISGGAHSHDDYGEAKDEQEDVMGYGQTLDASSAKPWLDRVASATATDAKSWKVLLYPYKLTYKPRLISSLGAKPTPAPVAVGAGS